MTAALPLSPRLLAALGVGLLVVLFLLVARPLLSSGGSGGTTATPAAVTPTPSQPTTTPAKPAAPTVVLLPGLPRQVAAKLRARKVAVVALYTSTSSGDRAAVGDARQGARAAGASFAAIDLLNEGAARQVQPFVGTVDTPSVLVVRRPGKIVTQLDGRVDSAVVEQAAHNAGARR